MAVSTPTPGIVCSLAATGWASATCRSWRSTVAIFCSSACTSSTAAIRVTRKGSDRPVAESSNSVVTRRRIVRAPRTITWPCSASRLRIPLIRATRVCHWVRKRSTACRLAAPLTSPARDECLHTAPPRGGPRCRPGQSCCAGHTAARTARVAAAPRGPGPALADPSGARCRTLPFRWFRAGRPQPDGSALQARHWRSVVAYRRSGR